MSDVNVKIPEKVIKMSFGARHSLFLTESGKLWAAGSNADGQLGNPASVKITSVPIQVNCPPNVRFIKIVIYEISAKFLNISGMWIFSLYSLE